MPRTTAPENYPVKYHEIVHLCGGRGEKVRLPLEGEFPPDENLTGLERLLKLRGHFYAFIGAVKRSSDPRWAEMKLWVAQTTVYLDKRAVCLWFSSRDQSWQSKAFESAGVVEGAGTGAGGVEASLARVISGIDKDLGGEDGK